MLASVVNGKKLYKFKKDIDVPEELSKKSRSKHLKNCSKDVNFSLIHDFGMPNYVNHMKLTPDEHNIFLLGAYKHMIRCYDLNQRAMKFERLCDEEPRNIQFLEPDHTKFIVLEGDKTLAIHGKGGIDKKKTCNSVVADMAYSHKQSNLVAGHVNGDVSVLDVKSEKVFYKKNSENTGITKCVYNSDRNLFHYGRTDGTVEFWDYRDRNPKQSGHVKFQLNVFDEDDYFRPEEAVKISDIAIKGNMEIGIGTNQGFFQLFDIRNHTTPIYSRYIGYEKPIHNLQFHGDLVTCSNGPNVRTLDLSQPADAPIFLGFKPYFNSRNLSAGGKLTGVMVYPRSGLYMMCAEAAPDAREAYVPDVGPVPNWCHHLTGVLSDSVRQGVQLYASHTFITREEVSQYGIEHLVGTNQLLARAHGYYLANNTFKSLKKNLNRTLLEEERAALQSTSVADVSKKRPAEDDEQEPNNRFKLNPKISRMANVYNTPLDKKDCDKRNELQRQLDLKKNKKTKKIEKVQKSIQLAKET